MSRGDNDARVHTHASNRLKKQENFDRKVVFKSVLGNPFQVQWWIDFLSHKSISYTTHRPLVPNNIQNSLLVGILTVLNGLADFLDGRSHDNRRTKRFRKSDCGEDPLTRRKHRKLYTENENGTTTKKSDAKNSPKDAEFSTEIMEVDDAVVSSTSAESNMTRREPPPIFRHLSIGINEVTRRLECQIKNFRRVVTVAGGGEASCSPRPAIQLIFVCRADVDPPILIAHLPYLVAAFNSSLISYASTDKPEFIKLVPLPKGAEFALAGAIGLRRVSVIAVDVRLRRASSSGLTTDSILNSSVMLPS
jgi:ribonuclease P/MRP protein subunit POP3